MLKWIVIDLIPDRSLIQAIIHVIHIVAVTNWFTPGINSYRKLFQLSITGSAAIFLVVFGAGLHTLFMFFNSKLA